VVTGVFNIGQSEGAAWQRRAVARLAAILDEHTSLAPISWTLATAGSALVGRVNSGSTTRDGRAVFDDWCRALRVHQRSQTAGSHGDVNLWAKADIDGISVRLSATVRAAVDEKDQR
jgi:hypothetical protein